MKFTFVFPGAFRLDLCLALGLLLMVLQLATGTPLEFAELTFLGFAFAVTAINLVGGLATIAGCCIASIALRTFVIAQFAKVLYGEPGQSRLEEPIASIGVLTLSMGCIALAALVCFAYRPAPLFRPVLEMGTLRALAILSFVVGAGSFFVAQFSGVTEDGAVYIGGVSGLLRRVSACGPLSIIAGTAYSILKSNGKRLFSPYNAVPCILSLAVGILFTNKQAMFEAFFYLILTAIAFGYQWKRSQLFSTGALVLLSIFILFPFAQSARTYTRGANIKDTFGKTISFFQEGMKNPSFFLDRYSEYTRSLEEDEAGRYFDRPNGVLERLSLIKPADSLISATLQQGQSGWEPILFGLADLLPRIILPHRFKNTTNDLGYKAGIVSDDDFGTSISFGFAADAFSCFGWMGVAAASFVIGILIIVVTRLLSSEIHFNIWSLAILGLCHHMIAESNIGGVLQTLTYQMAWNVATFGALLLLAHLWNLISAFKLGKLSPGAELLEHRTNSDASQVEKLAV